MAEYRICFSIADEFYTELIFDAKAGVPYEDIVAAIDKEKLAELACLSVLGYTANDIKIITPEQYDAEFGDDDDV